MPKQVIVIGAGLAGLAAAIRLARQGLSVQVFEQAESPGGKLSELRHEGYRFDIGPTLLTLPFVIDELYQFCGEKREDHLSFIPLEILCRYFYSDGIQLDAFAAQDRFEQEIRKIHPADAQALPRFFEYSRRIYELTADPFLFSPIHEPSVWWRRQNLTALLHLPQLDPLSTVHLGVVRFFQDPHVIQLFDRYATYNGSDPFQAPATLNVIPYVEYGLGGFFVQGGMYRLVEQLVQLARRNGVSIQCGSRVQKIIHHRKKIKAVKVDGKEIATDYVLCNGDVVTSFRDLLPEMQKPNRKLAKLEPSLSGLMFLWSVNQEHPNLLQHNIFFSRDYRQEFHSLFQEQQPPDDPTVYVAISAKSNPADAPPHAENWFVLVNMPPVRPDHNWPEIVNSIREKVLHRLEQHGVFIRNSITFEKVITPLDLQDHLSSNRGSIYGLASNSRLTAFTRPSNRSREIKGLFFAGGSSHPGGGVPLVLLSGKIASDLIMREVPQ
ncbi:MAG: phytoene desaturase family protein [Verrucomicrobia bacterium]|nr:phytoene desaturase family protein [Verrucomicrobiota bacterium]